MQTETPFKTDITVANPADKPENNTKNVTVWARFKKYTVKIVDFIVNKICIVFSALLTVITLGFYHKKQVYQINPQDLKKISSETDKLNTKIYEYLAIENKDHIQQDSIMQNIPLKTPLELAKQVENVSTEHDVELIYQAILTQILLEISADYVLGATENSKEYNKHIPQLLSNKIKELNAKIEDNNIKEGLQGKLIGDTELIAPLPLNYSLMHLHNLETLEQKEKFILHTASQNIYNSSANSLLLLHKTFTKIFKNNNIGIKKSITNFFKNMQPFKYLKDNIPWRFKKA